MSAARKRRSDGAVGRCRHRRGGCSTTRRSATLAGEVQLDSALVELGEDLVLAVLGLGQGLNSGTIEFRNTKDRIIHTIIYLWLC